MEVKVRPYRPADLPEMVRVWNEIVDEGTAFPQEERLTAEAGAAFFAGQTRCGVAEAEGREAGFRVLQFNAVVATNLAARRLYERLGFTQLGTIPGGFRMADGRYEDICPYYIEV